MLYYKKHCHVTFVKFNLINTEKKLHCNQRCHRRGGGSVQHFPHCYIDLDRFSEGGVVGAKPPLTSEHRFGWMNYVLATLYYAVEFHRKSNFLSVLIISIIFYTKHKTFRKLLPAPPSNYTGRHRSLQLQRNLHECGNSLQLQLTVETPYNLLSNYLF